MEVISLLLHFCKENNTVFAAEHCIFLVAIADWLTLYFFPNVPIIFTCIFVGMLLAKCKT